MSQKKETGDDPDCSHTATITITTKDAAHTAPSVSGMDPRLSSCLSHDFSIDHLFSVQKVVWEKTCGGFNSTNDICLCAPTGSGKTLAYLLPVVHGIGCKMQLQLPAKESKELPSPFVTNRMCTGSNKSELMWNGTHRLRALIVLPTRELVRME